MNGNQSYERQRAALRNRPRRVIFNNDGCDVFAVPTDQEATAENLLALRTRDLVGTHVDAIAYTTISSGFGFFTHNTRVGEVLTRKHPTLGNNIAQALIDQGRDCLQIMVDFGHAHGMEVFWSMRMNDTHDGAHRPDKPYFLFPPVKEQHPEYLIGTPEQRPRHGSWSAVDYGHEEVRDLAYRFVEEVCKNYDVDGVELDFFRHPMYFRSVAWGAPAKPQECEAMTALIRRIADMCRREGQGRERPILLAVRTPDSLEYCRAIGLDLEQWLCEGLIDIHVPSGYFRLNPWPYSVENAHAHEVKVWAGLSESRVGGGHHRHAGRASDASYRARALNAWDAGVDGVYLFNQFDPKRALWRELGDPDLLQTLDRSYFVSYRGRRNAAGGNLPYDAYRHLPDLNPENPAQLSAGKAYTATVTLSGGDLGKAADAAAPRQVQLRITVDAGEPDPETLAVKVNGVALENGTAAPGSVRDGTATSGSLIWALDPTGLRRGENEVVILRRTAAGPAQVLDIQIDVRHGASG